jgi:hypothetical protein
MDEIEYESCSRCGAMLDQTIYATKTHDEWHERLDQFAATSTKAIEKINEVLKRIATP